MTRPHEGAAQAASSDPVPAAAPRVGAVPTMVNGRHAFADERTLVLIARETECGEGILLSKREIAERFEMNQRSIDRALTRLRRDGLVVSTPQFNDAGAQVGNVYRATEAGMERAVALTSGTA